MSDPAPTLLICWHSQTGACEQAANAIAAGARAADVAINIELRHADAAHAEHVLAAQAVVFVAAENLAALSGRIKDFFDRNYYHLLDRTQGKAYASVICAGSDGSNAQAQLDRIATGLRLRRVAEPLRLMMHAQTSAAILAPKTLTAAQHKQCEELGAALAAGLEMGIF